MPDSDGKSRMLTRLGHEILRLIRDDLGAAVATEFVMALPLFVLVMAVFVETNLILLAKCGTTYAAYAAARSGSVWLLAGQREASRKAKTAAVQALVPYSSADSAHRRESPSVVARRFAERVPVRFPSDLVASRFAYAEQATTVSLGEVPGGALARVTYLYPFRITLFGKLAGESAPWSPHPRVRRITSSVEVPTARPMAGLGIPYF